MKVVLVAYASKHGGTAEIAEALGEALRAAGVEAVIREASSVSDVSGFDGVVLGSGSLPLEVLENLVERYIAQKLEG